MIVERGLMQQHAQHRRGVPGIAYMEMAWPPAYAAHHRGGSAVTSGLTIDRKNTAA